MPAPNGVGTGFTCIEMSRDVEVAEVGRSDGIEHLHCKGEARVYNGHVQYAILVGLKLLQLASCCICPRIRR